MISNGVADVEYHIPVPVMPAYNSNLRRGTRTINPIVHYETNLENKKYSGSVITVSGTAHVSVHDDEDPLEAMDDEDTMLYVIGVFIVQQFCLNKGLK